MIAISARKMGVLALGLLAIGGCSSEPKRLPDGEVPAYSGDSPASVYLELARAYLEQGQVTTAAQRAQRAVEAEPSNVEAHILLGVAQSRLGMNDAAEQSLKKAHQLSPEDPFASNALGTLYCGNRRYADAQAQFDAAIAAPRNRMPWVAMTNAGICLRDQGKTGPATDYLQRALQANPRYGPALLGLSRLSFNKNDYERARTYVNRYFEVAAPDAESLWLAYQIESASGNKKSATSYAQLLKTRFPDAPQTYRLLGL